MCDNNCCLQPEKELGDSDTDPDDTDETKTSKRKKKLESRLKIADLKQVSQSMSGHAGPARITKHGQGALRGPAAC